MNSYNNTLLLISIFLTIFLIRCQTYENKEASEHGALSLKDIRKDSSKFNLISGYNENNDQQKRQIRIIKKVSSRRRPIAGRMTTKKVTTKIPRRLSNKYLNMKYQLYRDINKFRESYGVPPLEIDKDLSIKLQIYVMRYINRDINLTPLELMRDEVIYFCPAHEKYDPIKFWSRDKNLLTRENIRLDMLDLDFSKLIWKSSKKIGCGVYGDKENIFTYCRITPRGNVRGQYDKNVFYRAD